MGAWNAAGNLFRLLIVVGTVIAIGLQSATQTGCNYAVYKEDNIQAVGIWYLMTNNECGAEVYDPDESDPFIWTARSCLSLSMLLATIGGILVAFEWCCCNVCCAGCIEMSCYMSAMMLAGGVNFIFGCELCVGVGFDSITVEGIEAAAEDGNVCEIGPGATTNTVALIIYLIVCILLCCTPEPDPVWKQ
ncbi:unnamed protein product [Cylindrotheca closterium]|uniref:Uncharacterized protein n=1 Tax=Cylindrotheca closterium TaxID=2856 RepID=A0AAD2JH79_9STRA|nr:unnamed protein product [Cylindrotheca closterium]